MNKREINNLMQAVENGDEVAFVQLYKTTYKGVFSFIFSYTNNYHTTEDLLQDTYIKVKTKAQSYKLGTNASAWILQIAKNTTLDFLRKEKHNSGKELKEEIIKDNSSFDGSFELHEILNNSLNDGDRQIVLLHLIYGYKNREIAKILDIPIGTVLWRYNKALKILKEKLKEAGYEE